MKFLVRIDVDLPADLPASEREQLLVNELERGRELRRSGAIAGIWRIPGGLRNVGLWEARDATELHELISSLPLFPYLRTEGTALARHPIDE